MTCEEFERALDVWMAGDHGPQTAQALTGHAEVCASCARSWEPVRGLTGSDAVPQADPRQLGAVRRRLREAFDRAGHPVVRFGSVASPMGPIFVGVTDQGLCDVSFGQTSEDTYRGRLQSWSSEAWRDDAGVADATGQLEAYFAGRLTRFTLPIDLRQVTPFTEKVLRAADRIAFGRVSSYGSLARSLGSPGASRAVGGALGRNPVPIVIPCHRVLASGGRLGGFTGGLDTKRALLLLEGHDIPEPMVDLFGTPWQGPQSAGN